jgi:RNA polymerase sigma-70 factor (ECF subfamily)
MGTLERQPSASSGELVDQAVDNPAAFVQLYRRHYDGVFRYCVHRLLERHTAEDVTSEVFLKAARHIYRFRGGEERQFRSWLFRVATNEINNQVRTTARRQKLLRRFHQGPEQTVTVCEDSNSEHLARLKEAVFRLRPRYQTIITLRFFENLKPTEIAEVLGCSPGTARSQLARAIAQLRRRLKAAGVKRVAGGEHDERP